MKVVNLIKLKCVFIFDLWEIDRQNKLLINKNKCRNFIVLI